MSKKLDINALPILTLKNKKYIETELTKVLQPFQGTKYTYDRYMEVIEIFDKRYLECIKELRTSVNFLFHSKMADKLLRQIKWKKRTKQLKIKYA
ncbi:hypothetical protein [Halarcobacter sp.]|uniref:hypothetical protein n=1 Tax=Halarcobacter sp. TaxID=2321133 RepID=UPI003A92E779